jgi:hypothetical protein
MRAIAVVAAVASMGSALLQRTFETLEPVQAVIDR